jgi:hypothetical protein
LVAGLVEIKTSLKEEIAMVGISALRRVAGAFLVVAGALMLTPQA